MKTHHLHFLVAILFALLGCREAETDESSSVSSPESPTASVSEAQTTSSADSAAEELSRRADSYSYDQLHLVIGNLARPAERGKHSPFEVSEEDPCSVKYISPPQPDGNGNIVETIEFSYSDLNPANLEGGGLSGKVSARTTNAARLVHYRLVKRANDNRLQDSIMIEREEMDQYVHFFLFEDRDSDKLKDAVAMMITKCGGENDIL